MILLFKENSIEACLILHGGNIGPRINFPQKAVGYGLAHRPEVEAFLDIGVYHYPLLSTANKPPHECYRLLCELRARLDDQCRHRTDETGE